MNINFGFLAMLLGIICGIYLIIWIFIRPFKKITKIILNSFIGLIFLWLINFIGGFLGFSIGVNLASGAICGILGIAGFILLIAVKMVLGV